MDDENILFRKSYLQAVISKLRCYECFGKVKVSFTNKYMDYKVDVQCEECGARLTDSQVTETPITNSIVYNTMDVGLGRVGHNTLTSNMCMKSIYHDYVKFQSVAAKCTKEKLEKSVERQHRSC